MRVRGKLTKPNMCGKPRETFLVHGEPDRGMSALETSLHEKCWDTKRPEPHQSIELA